MNMKWEYYVLLSHLCVLDCFVMSSSQIDDFSNYLQKSSKLDQHVKSGNEERATSDYSWESSGKFEGDIILNERQRKTILSNVVEGLARNGLTDTTNRWPNNELVYFINTAHFTTLQIQSIQYGIYGLAGVSCVKFRPYQHGDRYAVNIVGDRGGCFSEVGYQGRRQILNLDNSHNAGYGCFEQAVVMHELLHALGFYHMQSSSDRDEYVDVWWDNIIPSMTYDQRHNFLKYNSYEVTDFGIGYDYMSVMHYSNQAFSWNGRDTLVAKNGAYIGQRSGLSQKDVIKLNIMYCDAGYGHFNGDSYDIFYDIVRRRKATKDKPFVGLGLDFKNVPEDDVKSQGLSKIDYFSETTKGVPPAIFQETKTREH